MSIWRQPPDLVHINKWIAGSMLDHLGMRITEVGDDYLRGTMPVDARTKQPFGLLHGGASVALAESLGSLAGTMCVDAAREMAVGLDINANHVRAITEGTVTGTARPLHLGRTTQVWEIRIEDERGKLVCISRLTLAVVPQQTPRAA
jgi:1,4-dihydroxy-2-naphthoyl-CoA hydrolase